MVRSFICVEIDDSQIINQINEVISGYNQFKGVRAVKSSQLHLTLKFLGEVPEKRIQLIKDAIKEIKIPPFTLSLHGIGCFPNIKYIRVVWIGITEGKESLKHLAKMVEKELIPLGFAKDKREFSPHLTLARIKSLGSADKNKLIKMIQHSKEKEFGVQKIEKFILKKSTLTPTGPIYEDLFEVPLGN